MGWSWSLYFCQRCLSDCMRVGVQRVGLTPLILEEKEVAPELRPGCVVCAPYVDNANLSTPDKDSCNLALQGILDEFKRRDLVRS